MATALGGLGLTAFAVPAAPALASASGAAVSGSAAASSASAGDAPATLPRRSDFEPAVGGVFRAVDGERTVDLILRSVEDIAGAEPGDEDRYSLLFTAPGFSAADGIYTLRRSGVPAATLFLSLVGPRGLTRTLQAVVSRTAG